ncbi:hypothetical protein K502DRAFT_345352 [Neoconidiobolus thromboides FSU 785]|nr:hypothetical protein K502DRAFT_345352 [Neoconidiobolus thromboides FSU 785]
MLKYYLLSLYFVFFVYSVNLKCKPSKGLINVNPGVNFKVKTDLSLSLTIESINCTPVNSVAIQINTNGNSNCPLILKEATSIITIVIYGKPSSGEGTFTISPFNFSFKGVMRTGTQSGNPVEIRGRLSSNPIELTSQCLGDNGVTKLKVDVTQASF